MKKLSTITLLPTLLLALTPLTGCAQQIETESFGSCDASSGTGTGGAPLVRCNKYNPLLVFEADGSCGYRTPPLCDDPWIAVAGDPPTTCTETVAGSDNVFTILPDEGNCALKSGENGICDRGYCCPRAFR